MNSHSAFFPQDCANMLQLTGILQDYDPLLVLLRSGDFLFIDTSATFHLITSEDRERLYTFFTATGALGIKCLLYQQAYPSLKRLYAPYSRLFVFNDNTEFMYTANYEILPSDTLFSLRILGIE